MSAGKGARWTKRDTKAVELAMEGARRSGATTQSELVQGAIAWFQLLERSRREEATRCQATADHYADPRWGAHGQAMVERFTGLIPGKLREADRWARLAARLEAGELPPGVGA